LAQRFRHEIKLGIPLPVPRLNGFNFLNLWKGKSDQSRRRNLIIEFSTHTATHDLITGCILMPKIQLQGGKRSPAELALALFDPERCADVQKSPFRMCGTRDCCNVHHLRMTDDGESNGRRKCLRKNKKDNCIYDPPCLHKRESIK
jgi:hypothetical protein